MLLTSIVVSVVLTVVLNLAVRAFPGATERGIRRVDGWAQSQSQLPADGRRVRVFFPWKAMLLASLGLTILLNVFARVF